MSTEAPSRRKIQTFDVIVSRVIQETPDTVTLVFFTANEQHQYKAGQFLTVDPHQFPQLGRFIAYLEDTKRKKEQPRAYSVTSAPHEPFLAITVKDEHYVPGVTLYPPLTSPLLVHEAPVGTRMKVSGFSGAYTLPDDVEEKTGHVLHLVAGSGAVPNFSILKDALRKHLKLRHTFLASNRTFADICFRDALAQLERDYPERLRVVHTLTREHDQALFGPSLRAGRITPELISELAPDVKTALIYLCGPAITPWERRKAIETGTQAAPRFIETMLEHLHQLGVETRKVKRESWG